MGKGMSHWALEPLRLPGMELAEGLRALTIFNKLNRGAVVYIQR